MNLIIWVSIALLVALSAFLSSTYTLIDRRRGLRRVIKPAGWWVIVMNLVIIGLSVLQYVLNEHETEVKEKKALREQKSRDSILKVGYDSSLLVIKGRFDSSNLQTVEVISNTLGKYGYRFDSAQQNLAKIINKDRRKSICSGIKGGHK